jgi:Putative lumazine-binding
MHSSTLAFCLFVTVLVTGMSARSQTAEDSVKAVVNTMFEGMKNADAEKILNCFDDSAILQTIAKNKEGKTYVRNEKLSDFAAQVAKLSKGAADERIQFETVKIDGAMAIAWTPYQFYYNGQYSHQGVNMFQLVNYNGTWKIHFLIDTRRK